MMQQFPESPIHGFEVVAKLITFEPPKWLAEHLSDWAATIFLSREVEARQPSRSEMKKMLERIIGGATILEEALNDPTASEFLNAGGDSPMDQTIKFREVIGEIKNRATQAAKLRALVNAKDKPRAGRGRALLDAAIPAQTYCALLIAETWKWFNKSYPPPRNRQAAEAIEIYWKLAGGAKQSWGSDPLNSWRHHLNKASKIPAENERTEYRRHLREAERNAASFASAPALGGN